MWGLSLLHGGPQMWGEDHMENGGTGCERIHLRKKGNRSLLNTPGRQDGKAQRGCLRGGSG